MAGDLEERLMPPGGVSGEVTLGSGPVACIVRCATGRGFGAAWPEAPRFDGINLTHPSNCLAVFSLIETLLLLESSDE